MTDETAADGGSIGVEATDEIPGEAEEIGERVNDELGDFREEVREHLEAVEEALQDDGDLELLAFGLSAVAYDHAAGHHRHIGGRLLNHEFRTLEPMPEVGLWLGAIEAYNEGLVRAGTKQSLRDAVDGGRPVGISALGSLFGQE